MSHRPFLPLSLTPMLRALVLGGVFMFTEPPALAEGLPQGISQITSVEGITEYRLANGLRVLLMPDHSKPTVTVNMTYLVGSQHENYGETGMAHLLEHLMFKGTPNNPKIDEEFNKRGMRMNGTTSLDRTNYYELFQASDDNLKWALEMEADRMVNSYIAKKDLDTEMTVVRNEFEKGENSPGGVLMKRLQSVAYDWHNYGHATIGNRSDIENVRIDNLQAFYRTYYQPDNAVLLVAGQFEPAKALQWISKAFGRIPKPSRTLPSFWTTEPVQDGERSVVVRRQGDVQLLMIGYKVPADLHTDSDDIGYASSLLTSAPHGRLHKQLVETGKVVQVFSTSIGHAAPGLAIIGAVVKKGESIDAARQALLDGIDDFTTHPPTKEEIDRLKLEQNNQYEKLLSNHETVGIGLSEYIAMGDWRYLFKERDAIAEISADKISAAAKRYFIRDNRTVGMFIPDDQPRRAEIPAAPAMATVMQGFIPKAAQQSGEAFDTTPANIDRRTQLTQLGESTDDGVRGLKVALLPKKNRGDTVNVALFLRWGDEKTLFGKQTIANFTRSLLMTGTSKYSRAQLADELLRLKISGNVYNFQTTREHLPAAIALMAHILREANFPESEFIQAKEKALVGLESSRNEPGAIAARAMAAHFNHYPQGDFRYAPTLEESLAAIRSLTLADITTYHQQMYGASEGELSIVGDFDVDSAKQAIRAAFGNWHSHVPYARLRTEYTDIAPVRQIFDTPGKENGSYLARMNLNLREDDADTLPLRIANYIFGGGSGLNSRLLERIRQKDGLSYGGSSGLAISELDRDGNFSISAIAAPQNLNKLDQAIQEELARALKDGFTAEELAKAKSGLLQQRAQSRSNDGTLASTWNGNLYLKRTFAWAQNIDDKIQAMTLEQVNQAFRRAIDPAKMSVFIAGDKARFH